MSSPIQRHAGTFVAALLTAPAFAFALETLPARVHLKDLEQSFTWENVYALQGGRIWVKPNEETTGIKGEWKLFDGTGVPFGKEAASFGKDDRVESFAQDATMIMALSNKGRFYTWQPTYSKNTVWLEKLGTPFTGELLKPKLRTWGFSLSVHTKPEKRLTPMHDVVEWWQDRSGQKIEFGITATLYTLDPDGQRIRYWDTGLPLSFHKAFATPERGRFQAINMSVSGSTLFVVNKEGRLFTRLYDYETNGACPGQNFSYALQPKPADPNRIFGLYEAIRTLPGMDWTPQELPLGPGDAMTSRISISISGVGNDGRQLRVQGRKAGKYGYFAKSVAVSDTTWVFHETGDTFVDADIVRENPGVVRDRGPGADLPPPRTLDKTYEGTLTKALAASLKVELVDFYYFDSPATLRVHAGAKTFDMAFHTVDAWSMTAQQTEHPERVGTPLGEPKLLQGTLVIPREVLESTDPEIKTIVDDYFREFNLVPFAFQVEADDRRVVITSLRLQRMAADKISYDLRRQLKMALLNTAAEEVRPISEIDQGYTYLATRPELSPPLPEELRKADVPVLEQAIKANQLVLDEIKRVRSAEKRGHLKNGVINQAASGGFHVIDALWNVTGISGVSLTAGSLSRTNGAVLGMYAGMNLRLAFEDPADYERAVVTLGERIKNLKLLLKAAQKKK